MYWRRPAPVETQQYKTSSGDLSAGPSIGRALSSRPTPNSQPRARWYRPGPATPAGTQTTPTPRSPPSDAFEPPSNSRAGASPPDAPPKADDAQAAHYKCQAAPSLALQRPTTNPARTLTDTAAVANNIESISIAQVDYEYTVITLWLHIGGVTYRDASGPSSTAQITANTEGERQAQRVSDRGR